VKALLSLIGALLVCGSAGAAQVTLAWDPNKEPDVAGYRIYYGTNGFGTVVNAGNVTNLTIVDLVPGGKYSFYATCYNTSGLESEPSNVVEYTVPYPSPAAPVDLRRIED
jgi:fibronectin type 3 domain-containing protein